MNSLLRTGLPRRLALVTFGAFFWAVFVPTAYADTSYGPPYSYSSPVGVRDGIPSVSEAVQDYIADEEAFCSTHTCGTYTYSVTYGNGYQAAYVKISTHGDTGVAILASDVTGIGFTPKNVGGCRTLCTGGEGQQQDTNGPRGSSADGRTKDDTADVGTSLVADPINAVNGNAYRQDTDFSGSAWLTFRRFYNSSTYVSKANLGLKWRHSFDRSLTIMPNNNGTSGGLIYAVRPDGMTVRFTGNAGAWTADKDAAETLTATVDPVSLKFSGFVLRVAATNENEHYDPNGKLLSISDDSGRTVTLTYSDATTPATTAPAAGLLIAVTDPQGRALGLRYDASSRLSALVNPAGDTVTYSYANSGVLNKVTFPDGTSRQYVYAEVAYSPSGTKYPGALTGVIDEKGVRFETTTFNATNRALASEFAGGADKTSISYYNFNQNGGTPAIITTPLGLQVTLYFADDGSALIKPSGADALCGTQCNQPWQNQTYDTRGYPASYTDFRGAVTKTTYDANGLLLQTIESSGTKTQRTTTTTWDVAHRQPLTKMVADASGAVVAKSAWAYNARGQVTATCAVDPAVTAAYACGSQANAPSGIRQTTYTYCDAVDSTQCPQVGLLLAMDGPRTDVTDRTQYSYYLTTDESGCGTVGEACHRSGDPYQVTNALGQVTTTLAYDRNGRITRTRDANGVLTDMTYTSRGWLASRTVRANASGSTSASDATTTLTYDATGGLKSVTDPDGVAVTYSYDDAHRLVDMANGLGEHIHYTLDASGNRTREETFDSKGVSRRSVSRKYNTRGQLLSVTDGLGHVVFDATASGSYDANGNLVAAKDGLGIARNDTYDALNRLVTSVANANGADATTKATPTMFTFDALDQLKSVADPNGLTTTYAFDGLQNAMGVTSPDSGTQTGTFDAAGNPLTHADAKGTVVTQGFDALGRKTSAVYADAQLNVALHYDEANSATGCVNSFSVGRLTRLVEAAVTTVYCYDNQGRLTEQQQTQGTVTDITDYVYTKAGRVAAVASPTGLVTEYARDAAGQVIRVTVTPAKGSATVVVNGASYMPFGPLTAYTLGSGQVVGRSYDANYQASDVTSPVLSIHWARNASGDVTALGDVAGANPATETYTYDPLYRLTSVNDATGKAVEAYTYNRTGDRLTKAAPGLATGAYGYQANSHWLTSIGTGSRTYDANGSTTGNAIAGTAWGYGYNSRGQMTVVQQGGGTVATYVYNALDQRVAKSVGSATTRFAYAAEGRLLAELGATRRDYVWLGTTPVGAVDDGAVWYVHADAHDTPRALTNAAGAVQWAWPVKANPFGEAAPTGTLRFNLRFPGQYFDTESQLVHNGHRAYDPATGRYLQSDPAGLRAGASTYAYVGGNPSHAVDPSGLEEEARDEDELERERFMEFLAPRQGPNLAGMSLARANFDYEMRNGECGREPEFRENKPGESDAQRRFEYQQRYLNGSGGRWGGAATRAQNVDLRLELEGLGFTPVAGAGYGPEEYIPTANGGRYADMTLQYNQPGASPVRLRVQTVSTYADGVTPTRGEAAAADAIRQAAPSDVLILVPKR
jgi:RHS repeat-associated protein